MKSAAVFIENTQQELSELLGEKGLQDYMDYQYKVVTHLNKKKGKIDRLLVLKLGKHWRD